MPESAKIDGTGYLVRRSIQLGNHSALKRQCAVGVAQDSKSGQCQCQSIRVE